MIVGKYMNYESLPGQTFMNDVVDIFFLQRKENYCKVVIGASSSALIIMDFLQKHI